MEQQPNDEQGINEKKSSPKFPIKKSSSEQIFKELVKKKEQEEERKKLRRVASDARSDSSNIPSEQMDQNDSEESKQKKKEDYYFQYTFGEGNAPSALILALKKSDQFQPPLPQKNAQPSDSHTDCP